MVAGGEIVSRLAGSSGARIVPVDSEHSAIFQCLNGEDVGSVEKLILTASGGPFRGKTREELLSVSKSDALKHPNWQMGQKITIDSATLMNKGLEVIEARWLFGIEADRIDVIVHPQSIIHSMVEFKDKSVMAQLGNPDMRIPIQYALTYPQRKEGKGIESLDLLKAGSLTFEKPDCETFPCLGLAYEALRLGGTYTVALNAANEVLVEQFLNDRIGFYDIPRYIELALEKHSSVKEPGIDEILTADSQTRKFVMQQIEL
ncbi:1-deoxy-D-xylulose 5-phosphate reductoisomerase Dxr [Peptoclostridium acidaminophilum DSM 3953]|uniref:1-deoxy-D-xylulose-5-phosphate reductoisomerase n=1 Tax=Peptoclostridium acidaminophilum DSM 3953 TaxID=1286171 RepID=W8T4G9_PEPAC|nr:1-deoxy-D-xylulose-5-phosphate reductoisomerase [Peptoclostridium acidaminophilum]AHM56624.1 1-deoxy-D-xylulose 5-phosphate reductoisomerase Dxr [Peptoclostridium acidaminophilum DSM 3953]